MIWKEFVVFFFKIKLMGVQEFNVFAVLTKKKMVLKEENIMKIVGNAAFSLGWWES